MEGTPTPPAVPPRPPAVESQHDHEVRSLKRLLAAVAVLAAIATGIGMYALSEAQKEEEKPDDRPLRQLRVDVTALETELKARISDLEGQVGKDLSERVEGLSTSIEDVDKRVKKLEDASKDSSVADDITTQLDDLESRIEDLESADNDSN